jgi:hypothetical protein
VIPFSDVNNIAKKSTALLFNNAIGVTHKNGSEFFTSFMNRDLVFDLLNTLLNKSQGEESLGINLRTLIKMEKDAIKPPPAPGTPRSQRIRSVSVNSAKQPDQESSTEERATETVALNLVSPRAPSATWERANLPDVLGGAEVASDTINIDIPSSLESSWQLRPSSIRSSGENRVIPIGAQRSLSTLVRPLDLAVLRNPVKKKQKILKSDGVIPQAIREEMMREKNFRNSLRLSTAAIATAMVSEGEENITEEAIPEQDPFKDVIFPTIGQFTKHCEVDTSPCIDQVFPNITIKEFYKRLLYSQEFWEHVFVVTDSEDINIPPFEKPSSADICLQRLCQFVAPIKGAPVGPKQTRVRQTHRVSFPDEE